jgi:hypothetical protein
MWRHGFTTVSLVVLVFAVAVSGLLVIHSTSGQQTYQDGTAIVAQSSISISDSDCAPPIADQGQPERFAPCVPPENYPLYIQSCDLLDATVYWGYFYHPSCDDSQPRSLILRKRTCAGVPYGPCFCGWVWGSANPLDPPPSVAEWEAKYAAGEVVNWVCRGTCDCLSCEDEVGNCPACQQ